MKNWSIIIAWAFGLLVMQSCKDAYDFSMDNLSSEIEQESDFAIPLIDADITLEELLPDNEETSLFLHIDNDGFITLTYEDDIAVVSAPELFDGVYSGPSLPYNFHEEPPMEVPLNMDNLINQGRFYFADPKMTITIKNYWDVSTRFRFNEFLYYPKEGDTGIPLTGTAVTDWHTILPSGTNEFAITEIALNRTNSNIDEVISSLPYALSAGATIETIPGGPYNIDPNTEDSVSLKVEMPMDLLIEDLIQRDTVGFSILENYEDDTDALESLTFNLAFDNGFPVDLALQIYFADENYTILDSISATGINVTAGNSNNGTSTPVETLNTIVIENSKISNLVKSKYLIPKFEFNTKGAASDQTVKLYSTYAIGFKLGARIKLKIKT